MKKLFKAVFSKSNDNDVAPEGEYYGGLLNQGAYGNK